MDFLCVYEIYKWEKLRVGIIFVLVVEGEGYRNIVLNFWIYKIRLVVWIELK